MSKICSKCKIEKKYLNFYKSSDNKDGFRGACKECERTEARIRKEKNKERVNETTRLWRDRNQDHIKEYSRLYLLQNRDERLINSRIKYSENKKLFQLRCAAWRLKNPNYHLTDKFKKCVKAWRSENKEKVRLNSQRWQSANPEKCRIKDHNRRARKLASGGKLSHGLAVKLFKLQRGKCAFCKQPLGVKYHLDHIMPLALGGSNTDDNIQLLHATCNFQKSAKHPIDFMQQRGFLL